MTHAAERTVRRWLVRAEGTALGLTVLAAVIIALVAALMGGWPAARSGLLGAGDVVVFFALGVLFDVWAARDAQVIGMFVVLAGYGVRIGLLTGVAFLLAQTSWLSSVNWFAIGVGVATLTWLVGLVVGHMSGRWPVYDLTVTAGVGA
ncbi:MAG: hypothetical protein FWD80_02330 [Propionibacteriaceae bacterium]|nr:hypothetical protein [Propionibacteriaceae bacterium]